MTVPPMQPQLAPLTGSNPNNPFVCNVCKKTYSRLDHLGRHYRTHTSEKPFTCERCGKGFSRVDLLRRHRANHSSSETASPNGKVRARRATKACTACAISKLKCSEFRPCDRCVANNIVCLDERSGQAATPIVTSNATSTLRADAIAQEKPQESIYLDPLPPMSTNVEAIIHQPQTPFTSSAIGSADLAVGYILPDLPMNDPVGFDETLMGDFLRDVVYPNPDFSDTVTKAPLPDVLDFGFDDLLDIPPSFYDREHQPCAFPDGVLNSLSRPHSGAATPTVQQVVDIGQQAFKDSFWLWTPVSGENRAAAQTFLTIAEDRVKEEVQNLKTLASLDVSLASRDRLLSSILGTCEPVIQKQVLSNFPSGQLISSILTIFIALRFEAVGWWIHVPTLHINQDHEAFLAGLLAAAAVESRHPDIRKLGFAMQEAARAVVANRFEEDNRTTRDLRTLQAFALQIHAGFWSGGKRRMEISESFTYPLITMLRRAGQFRKHASNISLEKTNSEKSNIDDIWKEWVRAESLKRVAFHILVQDTAISMSLLTNPLVSQAEFQLELPCSEPMWTASSANEWKELEAVKAFPKPVPTLHDALSSLYVVVENRNSIDVQLSLEIVVSSLWSRVWQFRLMKAMVPLDGSGSHSLAANSLQQELVDGFMHLKMRSDEWSIPLSPTVTLKLEICLMHLHVALKDIQLFGGKEGENQARKMVPQLQTWSQSREARRAVYHAGQTLRAAAQFEPGSLRGFPAVAVYHASLVLWAYGVLIDPKKMKRGLTGADDAPIQIDSGDNLSLQRFLMMGQGSPCITDYAARQTRPPTVLGSSPVTISITNPTNIMNSIAALLTTSVGGSDERGSALPILANLSRLMRSLGKAAALLKQTGMRTDR